jgi:chemotaxis protein methyltransferase CheR
MLAAEDEAFVRALLAQHAGLAFDGQQTHLLDSRLTSLAKQQQLGTAHALVHTLRSSPSRALLESVVDALTTHETSFFRDRLPFIALAEAVIPELLANRRADHRLSIWSAGCSTGQEAYSVAILLRERFPLLSQWHVQILATDVSATTVQRARLGRFTAAEVKRGINEALREKYFEQQGSEFVLHESIRGAITWGTTNLAGEWATQASFDLVLMRNVLIYFAPEVRARILQRTSRVLASDGYLLLGTSETTFGQCEEFRTQSICGATVYRRVAGDASLRSGGGHDSSRSAGR